MLSSHAWFLIYNRQSKSYSLWVANISKRRKCALSLSRSYFGATVVYGSPVGDPRAVYQIPGDFGRKHSLQKEKLLSGRPL